MRDDITSAVGVAGSLSNGEGAAGTPLRLSIYKAASSRTRARSPFSAAWSAYIDPMQYRHLEGQYILIVHPAGAQLYPSKGPLIDMRLKNGKGCKFKAKRAENQKFLVLARSIM